MDKLEIPLFWHEKLKKMEVNGIGKPVDNTQTVYSAIRIHFTESNDPIYSSWQFTIRNGYVFRIK